MKLLVPLPFYRHGGVEKTIVALVEGFVRETDGIVLVSSDKNRDYFKTILPDSQTITYESFVWEKSSIDSKILSLLYKFLSLFKKLKLKSLEQWLDGVIARFRYDRRLQHLAKRYQTTHCLYFLSNGVPIPKIDIPLVFISHDLYWAFAPLTYEKSYVDRYNHSLFEWLNSVDLVFAISQKTRRDIMTLFPQFSDKIRTILWSGFPNYESNVLEFSKSEVNTDLPVFYFPSSFGIYKDQLSLLEAGVKLIKKGLQFKIILIGKETDNLVNGQLSLSQQNTTAEYLEYLDGCKTLYTENRDIFQTHFEGLGYVEYPQVEQNYRECSCVIVPSKYEGFGLAIAEAIVRGIPVICSDLEVFQEQIELYRCEDRIDIFPMGDSDALAACMEAFLQNPKPRLSAEEIDRRFGHWTWKNVTEAYVETLASIDRR